MTRNKGIVFDASCGISEEEQREIFAQINSIAEKNRLSLAASAAAASAEAGKGKKKKLFKAKKSGSLFPIVVYAVAIAVLAGGFIALSVFQGKTDVEVREGAKVYNSAERALIGELVSEQSAAARGELEQLSRDQSQTAVIEAQLGALFANLSRAINQNNLEEAATIIRSMRDFLNTPAFQGLRSMQARKDLYAQAINSFEIMVNELRRTQAALASGIMSLDRSAEATFAQLQETAAQLERDLDRERIRANTLQTQNDTLQTDVARENNRANNLQTQNNTLQTDVARENNRANTLQEQLNTRDNTIRTQTATITNRNAVVEQIRNIIQGGKALDDMTFNELRESTARIQAALQSLN
jgi:chromosome segregation ATPase